MPSKKTLKLCKMRGCLAPIRSLELCSAHYYQDYRRRKAKEAARKCVVPDCDRPTLRPGKCNSHQYELYSQLQEETRARVELRFGSQIRPGGLEDGCWEWVGAINASGYGRDEVNKRKYYMHRWAWMHFVGPIPDGHEVDHMCGLITCVRPGHLQPLTPADHRELTLARRTFEDLTGEGQRVVPALTRTRSEAAFASIYGLSYVEYVYADGLVLV